MKTTGLQIDSGSSKSQTVNIATNLIIMRRLVLIITSTGLLFALGTITSFAQSAAEVTDNFYATIADLNVRGLPDNAQLKELKPFLSAELFSLIKRDQKKQAAFIKKHPEEKPPWIEGDLFSSSFEGRTQYGIGKARTKDSTREVDVYLQFNGETDKVKWTDTAVLKKFSGKWLVTNILYKGKWQFKSAGSLLKALK